MPAEATLEQTEKLACTQILDYAKTFFQDPKNQQAFQVWLKSKEERQNGKAWMTSWHSTTRAIPKTR